MVFRIGPVSIVAVFAQIKEIFTFCLAEFSHVVSNME